jgi:hypothetical protein
LCLYTNKQNKNAVANATTVTAESAAVRARLLPLIVTSQIVSLVTTTTVATMIATIAATAVALRQTVWELAPSTAMSQTSLNLQHRLSTLCPTQ